MKNKVIVGVGLLIGIFLGIFVFTLFENTEESNFEGELSDDVIERCSNLSFLNTSYCLNNYVESIYNYNLSNQKIKKSDMSLEELKKTGGTCKHYAYYYERWLENLGYNVKHISLTPNIKHGFTVAYDNDTYCVFDQKNIWCVGD